MPINIPLDEYRAMPRGLSPQGVGLIYGPDSPRPDLWEVLGAAFNLENSVVNFFRSRPEFEPDLDPNRWIEETNFYESRYFQFYRDSFVGVESLREARHVMATIDREDNYRETLHRAGFGGDLAAIAAGVASPTSLIPIFGWWNAAAKGGTAGVRLARGFGVGAGTGAGAVGIDEAVLHSAQETRTIVETMFNVGGAAILSGLLGGAIAGLSRDQIGEFVRNMNRVPGNAEEEAALWNEFLAEARENGAGGFNGAGNSGVGAARTHADYDAGSVQRGALGVGRATAFQGPLPRLQNSPFAVSRRVVADLAESSTGQENASRGIVQTRGGSVEGLIHIARGPMVREIRTIREAFSDYYFGRQQAFSRQLAAINNLAQRGGGRMNYRQFKAAITDALLNNDQHAIAEVVAGAKAARREFDRLLKDALEAGVPGFKEAVAAFREAGGDPSYLTRLWKTDVIAANRHEFTGIIARHIEEQRDLVQGRLSTLERQAGERDFEIELAREREATEVEAFNERLREIRAQNRQARVEAREEGRKLTKAEKAKQAEEDRLAREYEREQNAAYKELLRDLKRGRIRERPTDLMGFIRREGGMRLHDFDALGRETREASRSAEIRAIIDGSKKANIIRTGGLDADDMLTRAIDAGYFEPGSTLDDLVDALDDALKGTPRFSRLDDDLVARQRDLEALLAELEQSGVDIAEMSVRDLMEWLGATTDGGVRLRSTEVVRIADEIEALAARFDEASVRVEDLNRVLEAAEEFAPEVAARAKAIRGSVREAAKAARGLRREAEKLRQQADLSPAEIKDLANETVDTILGLQRAGQILMPHDLTIGPSGPLKMRTLASLKTARVRKFVEDDIEVLLSATNKSMATDTALMRKFGSLDLAEELQKLRDEAAALIERVGAMSESDRKKMKAPSDREINARTKADLRDIGGIRDRFRGTYKMPTATEGLGWIRIGQVIRDLNVARLLGGMTISAFPDAAKPVWEHGMLRVMGTVTHPFINGLRGIKMAIADLELAGVATDLFNNARAMAMFDLDDLGAATRIERGARAVSQTFMHAALMPRWNHFWKTFTGILVQTRMLQAIEKVATGKRISRAELERLADGNIDEAMARKMYAHFEKHGEKDGPIWWGNTSEWLDENGKVDRLAVDTYRTFLVREVNRTIVTPGQEVPLLLSGPVGKMIGQFRGFSIGSMQRTLVSGLQRRDMAVLDGMMFMMGLGMLSYWTKAQLAGRPVSDDPAKWITEALDYSGVMGWLVEINNMSEKLTGGVVGMSAITGETASRYANRNAFGTVFGPSADILGDVFQVGYAVSNPGELTESDFTAARKLLPFQNLFYVRWLFTQAEKGIADSITGGSNRSPLSLN